MNKDNLMTIFSLIMFVIFLVVAMYAFHLEQKYNDCAVKYNECQEEKNPFVNVGFPENEFDVMKLNLSINVGGG